MSTYDLMDSACPARYGRCQSTYDLMGMNVDSDCPQYVYDVYGARPHMISMIRWGWMWTVPVLDGACSHLVYGEGCGQCLSTVYGRCGRGPSTYDLMGMDVDSVWEMWTGPVHI